MKSVAGAIAVALCIGAGASRPDRVYAQSSPFDDSLLARVRRAAHAIRGDAPTAVNYFTFADINHPLSDLVATDDSQPITATFPIFQIRFPRKWIVVDAGFDRGTWDQFSPDDPVTYSRERYDSVGLALRGADRIVLTHEHWDHAAGIERGVDLQSVAPRVSLTKAQLASMLDPPASVYVRLARDSVPAYQVVDFDLLRSIAPGVVVIRAAGHSPGSQMIYVQLASGRELLLVGDLVWNMAGLDRNLQKQPAVSSDIKEDREAIQRQMDWVRRVRAAQGIVPVPCHDRAWLETLAQQGVLVKGLDLRRR